MFCMQVDVEHKTVGKWSLIFNKNIYHGNLSANNIYNAGFQRAVYLQQ